MESSSTAVNLKEWHRLWLVATGLLIIVAIVYATLLALGDFSPLVPAVRAFTEAALVGGCADWFAVTVLFRKPFGLPIPHSAIIPNNKDRIAENLGKFIAENFLVSRLFEHADLQRISFAKALGGWLSDQKSRDTVSGQAAHLLGQTLASGNFRNQWILLEELIVGACRSADGQRIVRDILTALSEEKYMVPFVEEVLRLTRDFVDEHGDELRGLGADTLPWFVPRFVEHAMVERLQNKVREELDALLDEDAHPARVKLVSRLRELPEKLRENPVVGGLVRDLIQQLIDSGTLSSLVKELREKLTLQIQEDIDKPDSAVVGLLNELFSLLAQRLVVDEQLQGRIDSLVRSLLLKVVEEHRGELATLISRTVREWDDTVLVTKLEEQVGKDLQFVRINGTVVGGLVGLTIYLARLVSGLE